MKITGLSGQHYVAVGLATEKQLVFEGTVGDFFGAFNNGSIINLNGSARRFLGNNISNGGIIVQGNAQRGVGQGILGGIIVIRGNVTGDIGQLAKGGTIIISGNCGDRCGAYMFDGDLIIAGNVGKDTGLYMVGGTIFVGGEVGSLGANAQVRDLTIPDETKLKKYFDHYGITKATSDFKKIITVEKRPWKNKLFEFETKSNISKKATKTSNLNNITDLNRSWSASWSESEICEIIEKTKKLSKYYSHIVESNVILDKQNSNFRVEITVQVPKLVISAKHEDQDRAIAFDVSYDKVKTQIKKLKSKIVDHRVHHPAEIEPLVKEDEDEFEEVFEEVFEEDE